MEMQMLHQHAALTGRAPEELVPVPNAVAAAKPARAATQEATTTSKAAAAAAAPMTTMEFPAHTGVFVPTAIKPPSSFYRAKRDLLGEAQLRNQLAQQSGR
jgi:hypothetical protein